jgi:hypothetical protein
MTASRHGWFDVVGTGRLWAALVVSSVVGSSGLAAEPAPAIALPPPGTFGVTAAGWAQAANLSEIISFVLDVVATLALAAAMAYHPVRLREVCTLEDVRLPRLLFLYALMGMAIGFLVEHRGYIIGFVVFGIGGLLRFRTDLDVPADTGVMILVTLLGLCIGLSLPIMAILIAVAAWALIWVLGKREAYALEVRLKGAGDVANVLQRVDALAKDRGWRLVNTRKTRSKPAAVVVFSAPSTVPIEEIERAIEAVLAGKESGVAEWRLR